MGDKQNVMMVYVDFALRHRDSQRPLLNPFVSFKLDC